MEKYELLFHLSTILLIPLIPAFILYKFLPSKTMITGPFKGLNLNLTGAFGGYFLLVLISISLTYFVLKNQLMEQVKESQLTIASLNRQVDELTTTISQEKNKYKKWKMVGTLQSRSPESTKIFIDEENISINSIGKFNAMLLIKKDENNKERLPGAACFFNKEEGYSVIDLTQKENVTIDTSSNEIKINNRIIFKAPSSFYTY